ncbi:MAG: hypothetical protein JSW72_00215 [Candidatus Bathyarchaeota archaeon]|nr:MAG: hypothetical protein JSW72_00215 [Candidatus Bathyarchaeota archaeon]
MHDLGELDAVHRFTREKRLKNAPLSIGEDVGSHAVSVVGKDIYVFLRSNRDTEYAVLKRKLKNLDHGQPYGKDRVWQQKQTEADT